ncbi:MAG: GAF domain-containing protein [Gammaproteobacteria bacterium]|nr:GAF domain-containing protein [Gammaproteobacteria bacterium]MDE2024170.1 GAF domain-containing protein [Gammaproteobacteria bacterium]MDE2272615.1 GAF domain-containing protein [Gammaproteobacteria bacterium]
MPRRYGLLILITVFVVLACAYSGFMVFRRSGLPFAINIVSAHTGVIEPIPGVSLPKALKAGDQIDLAATPRSTRIGIGISYILGTLPLGRTYEFVIRRRGTVVMVPITSVDRSTVTGVRWFEWASLCFYVLLSGIALLALWRGRDRAAAGLALWAIAFLAGTAGLGVPLNGMLGLSVLLGMIILFLLARVGFYMLVESMVGTMLTPRARALWRGSFLLLLGVGIIWAIGGYLVFVATGWAELWRSRYGFSLPASYLVPVALLFASYRRAERVWRLRLRWMLWSSGVFVVGIFISDTHLLGFLALNITYSFMFVAAMTGFLYAVLRHRVVDVSVFIDRTLVYGGMTALVVGILAAVNSLVEHAALGTNASLLVQVIVPLALGIVLSRVRTYLDRIVEQVFFRKKYLAEKALRRFAHHCGGYEHIEELLTVAMQTLREKLGTPGVAIYLRKGDRYTAARREWENAYPESVKIDDAAFAAARTGQNEVDLSELTSALGTDGYVFPMTAFGELQGALVCANRPGEHYAAEERKLLTQVARQMGAAMFIINAREDRNFIRAVARGVLNPESTRAQALSLETGWVES